MVRITAHRGFQYDNGTGKCRLKKIMHGIHQAAFCRSLFNNSVVICSPTLYQEPDQLTKSTESEYCHVDATVCMPSLDAVIKGFEFPREIELSFFPLTSADTVTISIPSSSRISNMKKNLQASFIRNYLQNLAFCINSEIRDHFSNSEKAVLFKIKKAEPQLSGDRNLLQPYLIRTDTRIMFDNNNPNSEEKKIIQEKDMKISPPIPPPQPIFDELIRSIAIPLLHYLRTRENINIVPKGVIVKGPKSCGQEILVKSLANYCDAEFIHCIANNLIGSALGESEEKIKRLFGQTQETTKRACIMYLEDIDSVFFKRETSSSHHVRMVGQLLTLMDGIHSDNSRCVTIIIASATNANILDPALRRPGRFDIELILQTPNVQERERILKYIISKGINDERESYAAEKIENNINVPELSRCTIGYLPLDLCTLFRQALIESYLRMQITSKVSLENLTFNDFILAMDSVRPSLSREIRVDIPKITWDEIGGCSEAKRKIIRAVQWPLMHPDTIERLGIGRARGILLHGPPGNGKTRMAMATANSSHSHFLTLNGAEIFSPYLGGAEETIRDCFKMARTLTPCIIFIDEIDCIVGKRTLGSTSSGVQERVLSTLLNEMDGIEETKGVIVMGATNRLDMIDPALLRPGRMDEIIEVGKPKTIQERETVLRIHLSKTSLGKTVDVKEIAELTFGYSCAELENLCREACLLVLRQNITNQFVEMSHFTEILNSKQFQVHHKRS